MWLSNIVASISKFLAIPCISPSLSVHYRNIGSSENETSGLTSHDSVFVGILSQEHGQNIPYLLCCCVILNPLWQNIIGTIFWIEQQWSNCNSMPSGMLSRGQMFLPEQWNYRNLLSYSRICSQFSAYKNTMHSCLVYKICHKCDVSRKCKAIKSIHKCADSFEKSKLFDEKFITK